MRIKQDIEDIDYKKTRDFFERRAGKFQEKNPYVVTMYQDNNTELVKERNRLEIEKLYPKLQLTENSRVLDLACGIGRWADAISDNIKEYCGVDFSKELINIANSRNKRENFFFYNSAIEEIGDILSGKYSTVLLVGILMYLNDRNLPLILETVEKMCEDHSILCIREPVGISERLTLKDFYSDELKDNYNAIYRTRKELFHFFIIPFFEKGFYIKEQGFLFEGERLNNRKETAQYYYILER